MAALTLYAKLTPKDKDTREELLDLLRAASEHALKSEPGTLKYVFATNRVDTDDLRIYAVEVYADATAFENHKNQTPVQKVLDFVDAGKTACPPEISLLNQVNGLDFTRASIIDQTDPFLVITEIEYKPGMGAESLPLWKELFRVTRDGEAGAFLWSISDDPQTPDKKLVVHAYESQAYVMEVHAMSEALKKSLAHSKANTIKMAPIFLQVQDGYLYK